PRGTHHHAERAAPARTRTGPGHRVVPRRTSHNAQPHRRLLRRRRRIQALTPPAARLRAHVRQTRATTNREPPGTRTGTRTPDPAEVIHQHPRRTLLGNGPFAKRPSGPEMHINYT